MVFGRIPQELCDVYVVWQRSAQPDYSDDRLAGFDLTQSSRDNGFNDCPTFFIEKMYFIDNQQLQKLANDVSVSRDR